MERFLSLADLVKDHPWASTRERGKHSFEQIGPGNTFRTGTCFGSEYSEAKHNETKQGMEIPYLIGIKTRCGNVRNLMTQLPMDC